MVSKTLQVFLYFLSIFYQGYKKRTSLVAIMSLLENLTCHAHVMFCMQVLACNTQYLMLVNKSYHDVVHRTPFWTQHVHIGNMASCFQSGIMSILTANMREDDCNIIIILSLEDVIFSPPTFNYTHRLMEGGGHFTPLT